VNLTIRQLRYFIAVADAGQVSLAGSALGISQSAITGSIQALEAETGVKLVRRHRRGVHLTHEGYQFLQHARRVLAAVSDAARVLQNSNANMTGTIRLGVPPTVAGYFLAAPLAQFQRSYPKVKVEITELDGARIEKGLLDGSLDIALLLMSAPLDSRQIETQTMFSSRRRLWLAPSHRLMSIAKIRLRDVAREPYLLLTTDNNTETTARYWGKHGLKPDVAFRTVSIEAIRSLVAGGGGVTILSDLVYRPWSLEGDRIEARPLVDEVPDLKIAVAWKRKRPLSACVAAFRDLCREEAGIHIGPRGMLIRTD
jgi:DNA-binding transcriptional LysR family regulator